MYSVLCVLRACRGDWDGLITIALRFSRRLANVVVVRSTRKDLDASTKVCTVRSTVERRTWWDARRADLLDLACSLSHSAG